MSTSAPSRAKAMATARPMPESPPVIRACCRSAGRCPGSFLAVVGLGVHLVRGRARLADCGDLLALGVGLAELLLRVLFGVLVGLLRPVCCDMRGSSRVSSAVAPTYPRREQLHPPADEGPCNGQQRGRDTSLSLVVIPASPDLTAPASCAPFQAAAESRCRESAGHAWTAHNGRTVGVAPSLVEHVLRSGSQRHS